MNIAEIIKLKFPNADLLNGVIIQDDGKGQYIKKWDDSLGPQPDQAQLDAWAIEVAPVKLKQDARQNRRNEYPAMGDQLDMLFKAMDAGILPKVDSFYDAIKAVKDKYPVGA